MRVGAVAHALAAAQGGIDDAAARAHRQALAHGHFGVAAGHQGLAAAGGVEEVHVVGHAHHPGLLLLEQRGPHLRGAARVEARKGRTRAGVAREHRQLGAAGREHQQLALVGVERRRAGHAGQARVGARCGQVARLQHRQAAGPELVHEVGVGRVGDGLVGGVVQAAQRALHGGGRGVRAEQRAAAGRCRHLLAERHAERGDDDLAFALEVAGAAGFHAAQGHAQGAALHGGLVAAARGHAGGQRGQRQGRGGQPGRAGKRKGRGQGHRRGLQRILETVGYESADSGGPRHARQSRVRGIAGGARTPKNARVRYIS